jgi:SAM-dependent methyltransferase
MDKEQIIFLPGGDRQFAHLKSAINLKKLDILIIGANTDRLSQLFLVEDIASVSVIVDDHDSLVQLRYLLNQNKNISLKMMEFTKTDFSDSTFNLVFAQASISNKLRNKIIKEIKRILKPQGCLCVGEIVSLKKSVPPFLKNIWEAGNINPLNFEETTNYYSQRGFEIVSEKDLSNYLREYYTISKKLLDLTSGKLSDKEKSYHKKLLKRINHESNAYLKLGGNRFMGFTSIILRKTN